MCQDCKLFRPAPQDNRLRVRVGPSGRTRNVDNPLAPVLAASAAAALVLAVATRLPAGRRTFVGKTCTKKDDKTGVVTGDLLGVAKPVTLDVTLNKAGVRPTDKADTVGFSARGSLKRSDFGMKTFIPYIGDKIDLIIESEATR